MRWSMFEKPILRDEFYPINAYQIILQKIENYFFAEYPGQMVTYNN